MSLNQLFIEPSKYLYVKSVILSVVEVVVFVVLYLPSSETCSSLLVLQIQVEVDSFAQCDLFAVEDQLQLSFVGFNCAL